MTILNLAFDRDQALIASDELAVVEHDACIAAGKHLARCGCVRYSRSKVVALPHLRALYGAFGDGMVGDAGFAQLFVRTSSKWDMADVVAELGASLRHAHAKHRCDDDQAAVLVHCRTDGQIVAWAFQAPGFQGVELAPGALYLLPPVDGVRPPPTFDRTAIERTLADAARKQHAARCVVSGGRVHFSRLTRRGLEITWSEKPL